MNRKQITDAIVEALDAAFDMQDAESRMINLRPIGVDFNIEEDTIIDVFYAGDDKSVVDSFDTDECFIARRKFD